MTPTSPVSEDLLACKKCRRLSNQFGRLRLSHPDYWNKPVPASGPARTNLLIVGLAPGMHGANKTGKPFVGDASGDLLKSVLQAEDLTRKVRVTNAVKCLPVKNLPSAGEINNCSRFLRVELKEHGQRQSAVVLALGGVAHRAIISGLGLKQVDHRFAHGAIHHLDAFTLVDSYHCSRYNTQTGRLTRSMFLDVVKTAGNMAYP